MVIRCSVCGEIIPNLDEAILVGERYFCKICQHFPIGTSAIMCGLKSCGRLIVNPHRARKYHKECAKEAGKIKTQKAYTKIMKEKKAAWGDLSEERKLKMMYDLSQEFLNEEDVEETDNEAIETFINIDDGVKV